MCRIFGFRSILQSGVHKSLIDSENSIVHQSDRHPDGWGLAYYKMGTPHLVKLDNQAKECKIFEKVSGVVSSNTLITHIRKSTVGSVGPLNTHPFQFGPWIFAHNGNIQNFAKVKDSLIKRIDIALRPFILGDTDSEHLFYLLLTLIKRKGVLEKAGEIFPFYEILKEYVKTVRGIVGELVESKGDYDKNYLTFILTNGDAMYAFQGGQELFYSTHKKTCSDRSACSHFHPSCERKADKAERVHHLLVSSEEIKNENIWSPLAFGEYVGVDRNFNFQKGKVTLS